MAKRTVSTNQLTPGDTFLIRGRLSFCRITSQIAGEELVRDMQRRQQRRMNPIDRPYTTVSISNAAVIYDNPNQKTLTDIYAEESLYTSASPNAEGWCFTGYNKGSRLPWVGIAQPDGRVEQIPGAEGELATGLDVTLVMRVFSGKPNNGITMDGIICNEAIRYYSGGAGAGLAKHGMTFIPAPAAAVEAAQAAGLAHQAAPAQNPMPAPGYAPNMPNNVPPAPQGNPYTSAPAAQPYAPYPPVAGPYDNNYAPAAPASAPGYAPAAAPAAPMMAPNAAPAAPVAAPNAAPAAAPVGTPNMTAPQTAPQAAPSYPAGAPIPGAAVAPDNGMNDQGGIRYDPTVDRPY